VSQTRLVARVGTRVTLQWGKRSRFAVLVRKNGKLQRRNLKKFLDSVWFVRRQKQGFRLWKKSIASALDSLY
jgi:hypothetical protein